MSGAANNLPKARRLYDPEARQGPGRFPLGLSGFGQRWADREFRAEDACAELLELVSDLPSLRGSARELVDMWVESGRISESEAARMRKSLGGRSSRSDEVGHVTNKGTAEPESEILTTDSMVPSAAGNPKGGTAGREDSDGARRPRKDFAAGDVIAGRYELIRRVEDGSMGVVYQAIDRDRSTPGERHHVALKLLSSRLSLYGPAIRALQQEARTGQLLDHPRIVKTYGLERDGSAFFIVMEWCTGVSLARWLDDHGGESMPPAQVASIVADLGAALAYAHARGIVHADVKPGNIILDAEGRASLCDFGVARLDAAAAAGGYTFDTGVLRAATPAYASSQVLEGLRPTPQDDIYSLAAVTYRLLAGRRAFGGCNAREAAEQGLKPARVDGLEAGQWVMLESALSVSRDDRPARLEDFMAAFCGSTIAERTGPDTREEVIRAIRPGVSPPAAFLPSRIRRRRRVSRALALLVIVAGAAIAGSYFWLGTERLRALLDEVPILAEVEIPWLESPAGGTERADPGSSVALETTQTGQGQPADDGSQGPSPVGEQTEPDSGSVEAADTGAADSAVEEPAASARSSVALPPSEAVGRNDDDPGSDAPETGASRTADGIGPAAEVSLELGGRDRRPDVVSVEAVENEGAVRLRLERSRTGEPLDLDILPVTREEGMQPLEDLFGSDAERGVRLSADALTHSLTIPLPDDDRITGTRRYGFFLADSGTDGRILARMNLTVRDDELIDVAGYLPPRTVAFREGPVSAMEGDGAAEIRLVRFGGYEEERITRFVVVGESALEGEDYAAGATREVRFAPGEDNVTVFIPIVNDSRPEGVEVFRVVLDDPRGPIGSPSQLTVRILDDDR